MTKAAIVGVAEIAVMVEMTKQAVSMWPRRYPDFPKPIVQLKAGPVYARPEIEAWLLKTGRKGKSK